MKCQKCGSDVPAGSKFCNECGAKIEQITLNLNEELENKPRDASTKSASDNLSKAVPEKSPDKKPIYLQPNFYIGTMTAVIIIITTVIAVSQISTQTKATLPTTEPETTESETAESVNYNDYNFEEETTEYSEMSDYSLGAVNYQVPSRWRTDSSQVARNYHYNILNEPFFVGCTKLESDKITLNDSLIDGLINSDKKTYDHYKEQSKEIIDISGCKTLHRTFNYKEDKSNKFFNSYIFIKNDYLYLIYFDSDGSKQSPTFNRYEKRIINSITIDD